MYAISSATSSSTGAPLGHTLFSWSHNRAQVPLGHTNFSWSSGASSSSGELKESQRAKEKEGDEGGKQASNATGKGKQKTAKGNGKQSNKKQKVDAKDSTPPLKVLFLHGYLQSGAVLEKKTSSFRYAYPCSVPFP